MMCTPRPVPLNVPPSKDCSQPVGAHTLVIHRHRRPTHIDWARRRKRRGVRPLLDEDCISRIEQHPGNAIPAVIPSQHFVSKGTPKCGDRATAQCA